MLLQIIQGQRNSIIFSYGLLGPSGCGKTTLLRCIIGRLAMERGVLTTLGKVPGSIGHNVPGSMVGYMPQVTSFLTPLTFDKGESDSNSYNMRH